MTETVVPSTATGCYFSCWNSQPIATSATVYTIEKKVPETEREPGIGAGLSLFLNLGLDTVLSPAQIGTPGG